MYRRLDDILKNCDGVLITSPHNMRYFSGFSGGEGAIIIEKNKRTLFTDFRYIEQAQNEAKNFDAVMWHGVVELINHINESNIKSIAFEDNYATVDFLEKLKEKTSADFIGLGREIDRARIIKTESEIEKIKIAEEIGDKAFSHILSYIKEGVRERDIANEIEYFMKKSGAEKSSFDTIAISGEKTSLPHGAPGDKKLKYGEFITFDFGCVYDGYCSDMTRTVVLGKADKRQKEIYEIVYKAQLAGLEAIKNGAVCRDVDKVARDIIDDAGYGKYFGHSLGHGVGLKIHELPNLSPNCDIVLEENMVVSCEPGIYIPCFGGVRIEDLVVVKKENCEILSKSDKKLIEI